MYRLSNFAISHWFGKRRKHNVGATAQPVMINSHSCKHDTIAIVDNELFVVVIADLLGQATPALSYPPFVTMLFNLLVVAFFSAARCEATCEDVERFPNGRYLGTGYNVITGNPDNDLHDPGFAFSVLEFTWANGMTTSDGKFLVPDHIQALQTKSCGFRSQATTEFGSRSYQNALSVDVNVEAEGGSWLWRARFTASAGYRKVSHGTSQKRRVYTSARGKCIQYQLSVNYLHAFINVTTNFAKAVSSLPLAQNDSAYNTFIRTYGTHFTSQVTMGAKMVVRSEFDEMALTSMEETGLNVETGTKLSYLRFAAGVATETKSERKHRETFESMRKSFTASYLGSHPPSDGRWETWAQSTANSPYPVKYRLAPLTSLITDKFFPDMPHDELNTRRNLLSAAYTVYCNDVSGCGIPPPDRVPLRMKKALSSFVGSVRVSCPPTFKLLSCGVLNVRKSGKYDRQRYAIPANSYSCECFDAFGAKCVPWCSNTVAKFKTVRSALVRGRSSRAAATCPAGYKVLY